MAIVFCLRHLCVKIAPNFLRIGFKESGFESHLFFMFGSLRDFDFVFYFLFSARICSDSITFFRSSLKRHARLKYSPGNTQKSLLLEFRLSLSILFYMSQIQRKQFHLTLLTLLNFGSLCYAQIHASTALVYDSRERLWSFTFTISTLTVPRLIYKRSFNFLQFSRAHFSYAIVYHSRARTFPTPKCSVCTLILTIFNFTVHEFQFSAVYFLFEYVVI